VHGFLGHKFGAKFVFKEVKEMKSRKENQRSNQPEAQCDLRSHEHSGKERAKVLRWSARRKVEAVLRLLRGESLDIVARNLGVKASTLAQWREIFLRSGEEGLKSRRQDPVTSENEKLKAKIGELTMEIELLNKKIEKLECGLGPWWRRSRK